MKNLMTRKLVFGMLMAFVLVFSVQGIADAITRITKSASRDHQVVSISQEFTISFSVGVTGSSLKANYKTIPSRNTGGDLVTLDRTETPYYLEDSTPGYQNETGVTRAAAHNYDEEAIAISATLNGTAVSNELTLRKGSTALTLEISARSLSEDAAESDERLSSSVTLRGVATAAGEYEITITDVTVNADFPGDTRPSIHTPAPSTTFTIYVWQNPADSRASTIGDADGLSDGIAPEFGTVPLMVTLTGGSSTFARVEFEVTRGPGRLYEDKDGNGKADKGASTKLITFTNNGGTASRADVILIPNRGTSHVRAWVSGNAPGTTGKSTEAIYTYGYSQLKKISGDSPRQSSAASSRLEDPFVVEFEARDGGTLGIPDSAQGDPGTQNTDSGADNTGRRRDINTNSSGEASVRYLAAEDSGRQQVTATLERND